MQLKIRHLLYRSRELLIPVSDAYNYYGIDQRENELITSFNEILEMLENLLSP